MSRIAYVGNFAAPWSTENDYRQAFELLGHEVVGLQEDNVTYSEIRRQAQRADLLLWTGTREVQNFEESLTTLKLCVDAGVKTAAVHLDTFWSVHRGGRPWWLHPMFRMQHVFTADGNYPEKWAALGVNHHWLPAGVRDSVVLDGPAPHQPYVDVAFVGADGRTQGYHPEWPRRRELVDWLEETCVRRGWRFANPGGRHLKIPRERMAEFYGRCRVVVGDSLCPQLDRSRYWSDRPYEATGRGAMLVMPMIVALSQDFQAEMPMYHWDDTSDLEDLIEHYLADEEARSQVAKRCYEVCRNWHGYTRRAAVILDTVGL